MRTTSLVFLEDVLDAVLGIESLTLVDTLFWCLLRVFSEAPYLMSRPLWSSGPRWVGLLRSVAALAVQDTPAGLGWDR